MTTTNNDPEYKNYAIRLQLMDVTTDVKSDYLIKFNCKSAMDLFDKIINSSAETNKKELLDCLVDNELIDNIYDEKHPLWVENLDAIKIRTIKEISNVVSHKDIAAWVEKYNLTTSNTISDFFNQYGLVLTYKGNDNPFQSFINGPCKEIDLATFKHDILNTSKTAIIWTMISEFDYSYSDANIFKLIDKITGLSCTVDADIIIIQNRDTPMWLVNYIEFMIKKNSTSQPVYWLYDDVFKDPAIKLFRQLKRSKEAKALEIL